MSVCKRVLSVQSHVVSGYVGNKAAVFPLQLLGFDVSPINTVQFSNHTGYPTRTGTVMNGQELADIVDGLHANGLLHHHAHLLTGFIGSESFLQGIISLLQRMRAGHPSVRHGAHELPLYPFNASSYNQSSSAASK
jgi:pyridoxine kinase